MGPKARITRGATADPSINPRLEEVKDDPLEGSDAATMQRPLSNAGEESENDDASADAQLQPVETEITVP
jgi:hypothetical protein